MTEATPDPEPDPESADPDAADEAEPPLHHTGPPNVAVRNLVVGLAVLSYVAAWVADAFMPRLYDTHPLALVLLNPRNRNLVLASPYLSTLAFYAAGIGRNIASDPLWFLLGVWYGDAGVRWMERKSPTYGGMMRTAERWFSKAAYPLVAFAPNNFICLFAGAAGMNVWGFAAANIVGTVTRVILLRLGADLFSAPLDAIRGFIADYRLPLTIVSIALVAFTIWQDRRHGGTEAEGLLHLDDEIAEIEHEAEAKAEHARPDLAGEGDLDG